MAKRENLIPKFSGHLRPDHVGFRSAPEGFLPASVGINLNLPRAGCANAASNQFVEVGIIRLFW
ncbi:MAG: hypothetical protein ISN29_08925 [Gammaproteobacteria bacterium AqS3]|nr:hypothetical protein [Gammaproteobacteria bacterium AqS3]